MKVGALKVNGDVIETGTSVGAGIDSIHRDSCRRADTVSVTIDKLFEFANSIE